MKKLLFLLTVILLATSASATGFDYLNFVKADASGTSFAADGIKITFNGSTANVTTASGTSAVSMNGYSYLEFSNTLLNDAPAPAVTGDVNGDGKVDVADINCLINIILGNDTPDKYEGRAYVNSDDKVDIADINMVIDIILNS